MVRREAEEVEDSELKVLLEHVGVKEGGSISALAWAASESRPGLRHGVYVLLSPEGRILRALCDCEGFIYRKRCKHIERTKNAVLALLGKTAELQPATARPSQPV
jgi:hypothetical protein